jgi:hypothetical protein
LRSSKDLLEAARQGISIAALLRDAGRAREAEEVFGQILADSQLKPNPQINQFNDLVWELATEVGPQVRSREPRWVVELAKRNVQSDPKHNSCWKTLGVAQYRAGDWKAAVAALEKSMALGQKDVALTSFYLTLAHWRLGDKAQARRWYDQARQWMDKNRSDDEGLRRLRAEATELLGIEEKPINKNSGIEPTYKTSPDSAVFRQSSHFASPRPEFSGRSVLLSMKPEHSGGIAISAAVCLTEARNETGLFAVLDGTGLIIILGTSACVRGSSGPTGESLPFPRVQRQLA